MHTILITNTNFMITKEACRNSAQYSDSAKHLNTWQYLDSDYA